MRDVSVLISRVRSDLPITSEECEHLSVWIDEKKKEQVSIVVIAIIATVVLPFVCLTIEDLYG